MEKTPDRLYKIGEISNNFNISVQTLRLYERNGLFVPAVINEETGYRYYRYTQFERLRMIIFLKSIGLSLGTIKHLVDMPKDVEYVEILENYKNMLERKVKEENAKIQFLSEKIHNLRMSSSLPENEVILQHFPAINIVRYNKTIIGGYAHEIAFLEFMDACQLTPGFGRIGQLFFSGRYTINDSVAASSVFVREEMCNRIPEEKAEHIYHDCLPEGLYATMYYQKTTTESAPYFKKLLDEVNNRSLIPIGEIIRTVIFDIGSSEYKGSGYLACIRILVKTKDS